jgi:hypothetical protein
MEKAIMVAVIVGVFALWALFGIKTITFAPDNAAVITDEERQTYASPPCAGLGYVDRDLIKNPEDARNPKLSLHLMDYADTSRMAIVRDMGWKPDAKCRNADGLTQTITLFQEIFGYTSRWTPQGEWRW